MLAYELSQVTCTNIKFKNAKNLDHLRHISKEKIYLRNLNHQRNIEINPNKHWNFNKELNEIEIKYPIILDDTLYYFYIHKSNPTRVYAFYFKTGNSWKNYK